VQKTEPGPRKSSVVPRNCVFIGDNPHTDIEGAKSVGMKTVWIERHLPWPSNLNVKPDFTIKRLEDVPDIDVKARSNTTPR
jgi:putative hydrolase of the HAD superfamily